MVEPLSRKRSSHRSGTLNSMWQQIRSVNFLYWQYIYYFVLYLISSLAFLISGLGGGSNVGYLNSLFLCISAGTGAGLNTVELSTLNTFQQVILWLDIIMGSHTFVFSGLIIALRIKYKRRKTREEKRRIEAASVTAEQMGIPSSGSSNEQPKLPYQRNAFPPIDPQSPRNSEERAGEIAIIDGATSSETVERLDSKPGVVLTSAVAHSSHGYRNILQPKAPSHNSNTEEELEMRFQAFSLLSWVVPLYIILIQLCGAIVLGWFISAHHPSVPAENHVSAWWSGIFLSMSAFNNSGMSLISANMAPFQQSYLVLFVMSVLILLGNTVFPIFLRIIIRFLEKVVPGGEKWKGWRDGLRLLIGEKSRILCPYLFTRRELFWLAGTVVILNGIDWAAFGISASGDPAFEDFPVITRVVDGLFQAFAVRSGGFGVVNIPSLKIGVQSTYLLMMYISSFPISTDNVLESETSRSNGLPRYEEIGDKGKDLVTSRCLKLEFLKRQFRRTFTVDDFWLLSGFTWLISVIETHHFEKDPVSYSIFNIVFEVVSAYGCVGVSMGYPDSSTSFSGALRGGSRLLLCIVMLLGRTREARVGVMKGDWGIGGGFPGMEEEEWEE